MKALLSSFILGISGKVDKNFYCRVMNGRTVICRMPRRSRGQAAQNSRLAEASRRARVLLEDNEFRKRAEREMREWNRRFPPGWRREGPTRHRRSEPHPYTSLFLFVVAGVMREME